MKTYYIIYDSCTDVRDNEMLEGMKNKIQLFTNTDCDKDNILLCYNWSIMLHWCPPVALYCLFGQTFSNCNEPINYKI